MTATIDQAQNIAAGAKPSQVVVSVRGLTKVFNDFWGRPKARAVDNLDFDVYRGEVFGLLGPNGSGKSTTVKMLLGLLYPTRGHIQVFGRSPRHVATKARIGYLPEESYLYRYLSAQETLDFFGRLFELPARERMRRTEQLLEMVGLSQVGSRPVGEFSKGMQRRIGLAQALINDPDLVILDEPTSGLDPIGCREMKDLILALARRGKTVILSSHLLADVEDVCDRVLILYGGRLQAVGPLKELLRKPDRLRITTPVLSRPTLERVLATIRSEVGDEAEVRVENPTQNLESFFLEVVERARRAAAETSGALSGVRVAPYLRGETEAKPAGERLLEKLTLPSQAPERPAPLTTQAPAPAVDEQKLQALAAPGSTPPEAPPPPGPPPEEESLAKADEKLASLLSKPKG